MNEITEQWLVEAGFRKEPDDELPTGVYYWVGPLEVYQYANGDWRASVEGGLPSSRIGGSSQIVKRGGDNSEPPQSTNHVKSLCYALGITLNPEV